MPCFTRFSENYWQLNMKKRFQVFDRSLYLFSLFFVSFIYQCLPFLYDNQNNIFVKLFMGQEDSKPQISLKTSPRNVNFSLPLAKKITSNNKPQAKRVECDGLLKLQSTPFKNCIEIQTQNEILFLQNVQITLKQLLEGRLNTNKLFLVEDIERLIEGVTFALAHLQENGVTYKDIDTENIFYDNGNFKLLPNELIYLNTYQKLKENTGVFPSPELIIALRCGEQEIYDEDIVEKSNVFTFGMILLEVCTLLPSEECYDSENYDILDSVINERINLIEEYYGERIAKIIANMLDYDYTERMNLKDLSIWVNRQLQSSKVSEHTQDNMQINSIIASKVEKNMNATPTQEKSRIKLAKNNSVYMNSAKENGDFKEQRNKIYINDTSRPEEQPGSRVFGRQSSKDSFFGNRRKDYIKENPVLDRYIYGNQNQSFNEMDSYKMNESLSKDSSKQNFAQVKQNHPYQFNEDYKINSKKEGAFDKNLIDRETVTKRIAKEPTRPFRNQNDYRQPKPTEESKGEKAPLRDIGNHFYPSIDQVLKSKASSGGMQIKGPIGQNGSLNRIKQQILKSRKLIEQFKRTENMKYC